ncbi:MAG: hypothetical protein FJ333_06440 [Sphingomonadales bacterium]|nr:hypothetical protein [Sphingomonadales bacterium]
MNSSHNRCSQTNKLHMKTACVIGKGVRMREEVDRAIAPRVTRFVVIPLVVIVYRPLDLPQTQNNRLPFSTRITLSVDLQGTLNPSMMAYPQCLDTLLDR